jgi:hypothetical protein
MSSLPILTQNRTIKQEKEIKGIQIRKEVKLSLLVDDMILYLKDPKDFTKKLQDLINTFRNVAGCKIHKEKLVAVL